MENYSIAVSLNSENCMEAAKPAQDFDIPTTTLTTVSKSKGKIISRFFSSK